MNNSKMRLTVIITAALLAGCDQPTRDLKVEYQAGNQAEHVVIDAALSAFKNQCQPLLSGGHDIPQARARVQPSFYWQRERDWRDQVIVTLQFDAIDHPAAGHTCTYMIDTAMTEISVAKDVCMRLCDIPVTANGDNGFARLTPGGL